MGSARQQHAAGEGGEGRYGDQSEGPYHRMDDLRRHIFVVQDVPDGGALSHKDHQQGHKAAGISQKKGRGHGAHGGPAHVHSGAHRIPAGDVGAFIHHLVHRRADVHAQVHHRAGGAQEDGGHKDAGQIQIRKAAVEQTFGIGHDRPVDAEGVGEQNPQHTGDQHPQSGPGHGGGAAAVEAVHQGDDEHGEHQSRRQADEDGIVALQIKGDEQLPDHQYGKGEGSDGPNAGLTGEEDEQGREAESQHQFPVQPVVVDHVDGEDGIALIGDDHQGLVADGEDLILLQGAVEHIVARGRLPLERSAQQFQRAGLLSGADQAGVHDGGIVHGHYPGCAAVVALVVERALKARGQERQQEDQQQADRHGGVIAALGAVVQQLQ